MVALPKYNSSTPNTMDYKYVILFQDKLIIAENGPEASTETNIYQHLVNQFYLDEIILDCANGFYPCTTNEYARIHLGKETVDDAEVKEYYDKFAGPGVYEAFTDVCVVFGYVDEDLTVPAQKKIVIICQPKDAELTQNLGNLLKDLGPTTIQYNSAFKNYMHGVQNAMPVRSARCKGFDATEKIFLGHVVVFKNRIGLYSEMDEFGLKNVVMEAYYTQMLPLMKETEALITNSKDGFCFNVYREGSDPFNFCFDNKRIRDVILMTTYNNYMLYKLTENGYRLSADAMNCDEVKSYQMIKNSWEVDNLKTLYPADYTNNIEQSRKFFNKNYSLNYSPQTIEGETAVPLDFETLYTTCEAQLPTFKAAYSMSFIQTRSRVSFMQTKTKLKLRETEDKKTESKEGEEEAEAEPTPEELEWRAKLAKGIDLKIPLPDIRIPVFDKSQCKEGEDTFMCMTDFLSKHYNRIKCDPRLRDSYYAKYLYPLTEQESAANKYQATC